MIPKPTYRPHKSPKDIPAKIRQQVHERDGHICQRCGQYGNHLHHIEQAPMGGRRDHSISNIITLCQDCHIWVHSGAEGKEWARNGVRTSGVKM